MGNYADGTTTFNGQLYKWNPEAGTEGRWVDQGEAPFDFWTSWPFYLLLTGAIILACCVVFCAWVQCTERGRMSKWYQEAHICKGKPNRFTVKARRNRPAPSTSNR